MMGLRSELALHGPEGAKVPIPACPQAAALQVVAAPGEVDRKGPQDLKVWLCRGHLL